MKLTIQVLKYAVLVKYLDEESVTLVVVPFPTITILSYVAIEKLGLKVATLNAVVEQHFITHILAHVVVEYWYHEVVVHGVVVAFLIAGVHTYAVVTELVYAVVVHLVAAGRFITHILMYVAIVD